MESDAERVDDAARKQHDERLARQRSHDGIKRKQHGPALKKVERDREFVETAGEAELYDNAGNGDGPHGQQHGVARPASYQERERRVAAGNHDEDRGIVQAPEDFFQAVMRYEVVSGRRCKHANEADAIDDQANEYRGGQSPNSAN